MFISIQSISIFQQHKLTNIHAACLLDAQKFRLSFSGNKFPALDVLDNTVTYFSLKISKHMKPLQALQSLITPYSDNIQIPLNSLQPPSVLPLHYWRPLLSFYILDLSLSFPQFQISIFFSLNALHPTSWLQRLKVHLHFVPWFNVVTMAVVWKHCLTKGFTYPWVRGEQTGLF